MDLLESPKANTAGTAVRTLKIEEDGDYFAGRIKPKIRLSGRWLERAGFKPGTRVLVKCLGQGVIELRSAISQMNE